MRQSNECTFRAFDGTELFYRHWPAPSARSAGAIALFHRGHEHSGRMAHLADELGLDDFTFYAWDSRGHGRSPGPRGFSPSLGTSVRDVDDFIAHVALHSGHAVEDIAVIAQSVGAVLVSTWLHDYAPRIRCAVLASPAFKVKLYIPLARPGLTLIHRLRGNFFLNSYVKARFLTHDEGRVASYNSDPLISRPISINILLALYETAERVVADAQAVTVPVQLLISGTDRVVHDGPQHEFFERLGSPVKEKHVLPGFYHDTLGELDRQQALALVRDFVRARFAGPRAFPDLTGADKSGPTKEETDRLAAPLPPLSPRGLYWAATRFSMRLGGALSDGIRLGHDTGFDSGSTLDYVYRNVASGRSPLGRFIDRRYLDSIGWRGIRQRKLHIEEFIREALRRLQAAGEPIHVMDIAAGHGRYVLEAIESADVRPSSILLRDYSDLNVRQGTALIHEKGLEAVARFVRGDAFDRASLAAVAPRPTLAIVSGLYELFPDNELVGRSLAGLADAVPAGGYLIYTGQPWHPQLELIARTLTSHRAGKAWVMRRRTQGEMDQLVERVGFRKLAQRIDEWGIFTVSLAAREDGAVSPGEDFGVIEPRPWRRAIAWIALLGPFFFASYGFANWLASRRVSVGAVVFPWEHAIPFVPWTIVPYWSIDLLYGLSLLICATRRELDRQAQRLLTVQVVSIAFFIAFPLRFSFDRPAVGGVFGALFAVLGSFDKPYNQAPSLHIGLLVVIWTRLAAHCPLWWRWALHAWMAVTGLSILTTYQHHFIDLPTGLAVGFAALWALPENAESPLGRFSITTDSARRRLAARYALGTLASAALTCQGGAWLWLAWPAIALGLVALNYVAIGVRGFQKAADGRLSVGACGLLAPYLAGAWVNSRLRTRHHPLPAEVIDGVSIGRIPSARELAKSPFAAIVDLAAELPCGEHRDLFYGAVPVLDLTIPTTADLRASAEAIEEGHRRGSVLVCCALGYSRSAAAVVAWILMTHRAGTVDAARHIVQHARPAIVLTIEHCAALQSFA